MKCEFVRAVSEDWCPERLQRRHVLGDEVAVVEEEGGQTEAEHGRDEEEKEDVKPKEKNREKKAIIL